MSEVLELLKPITISGSKLMSSSLAEPQTTGDSPDPAVWNSATTYTQGQRVMLLSTHTIYEATSAASNTNKDPSLAANSTYWLTVGATNKWRMFDEKSTSQTTYAGGLSVVVAPGSVFNAVALINITGADSLTLKQWDPAQGAYVYNKTWTLRSPPSAANAYAYCFDPISRQDYFFTDDLSAYQNSQVTMQLSTANGTDVVGCGAMVIGPTYQIGNGIHYGARVGITDYSRKEKNAYGDWEITERGFASKGSFQMWVDKKDVDFVKKLLASVRAVPCLWRGNPQYNATQIYGFFKDWEITIQYFDVSLLNIELEGITEQ